MSDRIVKNWTETTEEAFGESGKKGLKGELFFIDAYTDKGWTVLHYESDRIMQMCGIDVVLIGEDVCYTVDVKANMREDESFYVETASDGWLFNEDYVNEFVSHVNADIKTIATYRKAKMQNYIKEKYGDRKADLVLINKDKKIAFIKWQTL